jgi:hypothetical protein
MTMLMDPVPLDVPSRSAVEPTAPLDRPAERHPRPRRAERVFDLVSPNGYLRTVTGTIEYLDEEANTYMVRGGTGELLRVPLRDIRAEHGVVRIDLP